MDTIPDREFIHIFNRTAKYVNIKGGWDPKVLDGRMKKVQKAMFIAKSKSKKASTKRKWGRKAKAIKTLRERGFARRVIEDAIARPYGYISNCLKYGVKKAKEIMLSEKRKRIRQRQRRKRR